MGLEIVLKDIAEGAQAEKQRIEAEAKTASEEIIEEARQTARESLGSRLAEVEENLEKQRQQVLSSANLEVKRTMLNKRKALLDQVYDQALESIKTLPAEKNEEYLKILIEKYGQNGSVIYSNADSEAVVRKLSDLKYGGNIDCIGGIIVENEDGTIRLDYTYDLILKSVYDRSLKSISDILNG
ncbi:V-type ATP synthase subunit E [Methanosarcinaceae archaeon]|jgi:V/A-type H+-transporting ATPase subunit E|nr:V-type ATP synthase subunit E [Methanosarcinaceae archaeon]MBQ3620074.1 V-type ATP synthase subunit E [Methanosarcinaceae archaeon]